MFLNRFAAYFLGALLAFLQGTPAVARPCHKDRPIVIAVVDTGFGFQQRGQEVKLCRYGHKDFTTNRQTLRRDDVVTPVPQDQTGHGTMVAGIIDRLARQAGDQQYCLVIVKWYDATNPKDSIKALARAIQYADNIRTDYLNISGGGAEYLASEQSAVEHYLDHGGQMIAAAGNEGRDIDPVKTHYYPANYDARVIVVGSLDQYGFRAPASNHGVSVTRWAPGERVESLGLQASGTSFATAIVTGSMVEQKQWECR